MRSTCFWLALLTALAACSSATALTPSAQSVAVYKTMGSTQCAGGGTTLAALQGQLDSAGIRVLASSCGRDGRMYAAVCGAPDGAIAIFQVPAAQLEAASMLGFTPLSKLPSAAVAPCRDAPASAPTTR